MDKFNSLLGRFENFVNSNESGANPTNEALDRFEKLIERLEKIHYAGASQGGAPQSSQPKAAAAGGKPGAPQVDLVALFKESCFKNVADLEAATKEKGNEHLVAGINHYLEMLRIQEAVLRTMSKAKKPVSMNFITQIPTQKKKALFDLGRPGRAVGTHLRCLEDSVNIFCWMTCPEDKTEFKDVFDDFFGAIEFQGQKLVGMDAADKKWYQAFRVVHKDFYDFIKANHPAVLNWTGDQITAEAIFNENVKSLGSTTAAPAQEEAKAAEPVKAAPTPAAAVKKAPAAKPASKVLKFKTWEVSNFVNETVKFTEEECQPGYTLNFFDCVKCKVIIPAKVKNIMFNKCTKTHFTIHSTMSSLEVLRCSDIQVLVLEKVGTISVQVSNGVGVILTEESKDKCQVETTASQSVSITFPKAAGTFDPENEDDQPEKLLVIPETYISKIKNEELETLAAEPLE